MNPFSYLFPVKVASYRSKYNGEIRVFEFFGKKFIMVAGAVQTGGVLTPMWQQVIGTVKKKKHDIRESLVLGVGGGDVIRALHAQYPFAKITGIDIDPIMMDISKKHFGLDAIATLDLRVQDARKSIYAPSFVRKFDCIVIDIYKGMLNLQEVRHDSFLKQVKKLLRPGGCILYSSHYTDARKDEFRIFFKQCKKYFPVAKDVFQYPYNHILYLAKR